MITNSSFISTNTNDYLNELRGIDLQDFLIELNNYYLTYRSTLYLPNYVTFGTEIEFENVSKRSVKSFLESNMLFNKWFVTGDSSLESGGEVVSCVLTDQKRSWKALKKVCNYLNQNGAGTSKNAGGHIHLGAHILAGDINNYEYFAKLWAIYEHVIYRFLYGDKLVGRPEIFVFANPIRKRIFERSYYFGKSNINELRMGLGLFKDNAINLNIVKDNAKFDYGNTIEVRVPNATDNEIIWQNNINFMTMFLLKVVSKQLDEEEIDDLFIRSSKREIEKYFYDQIFLEDSLKLVDLIFDNNLDKCYFLRQYLKSFEYVLPGTKLDSTPYAKTFTKRK